MECRTRGLAWLLAAALLLLGGRAVAVNIDNVDRLEPVVRTSLDTSSADQFGFSVVLHQTAEPNPSDDAAAAASVSRILVGAPRGNFPGGTNLVRNVDTLDNTGLVYQCPVSPGECGPIGDGTLPVFDGTGNTEESPGPGRLPEQIEQKAEQLLGQTIMSTGDTFLACAPRWFQGRDNNVQPRGRCYFSGRDLSNFTTVQPCTSNEGVADATRNDGFCASGSGATVFSLSGGFNLAIGSPGLMDFSGAVHYVNTMTPMTVQQGYLETTSEDLSNYYQGFQVAAGNIESPGSQNILASVPRYDSLTYAGRVNVFDPTATGIVQQFVDGDQIGSFFGYSLIAADLNNDSFDEVIVGAPMYSDFDSGVEQIERGRVYIFENQAGTLSSTAITLDGRGAGGRFGFSLANLGDIDDDGREDFAVGAPYTDSSGGANYGSVFIYYGREDLNSIAMTKQEITAQEIVDRVSSLSPLRTFGFSVSGGVDVDNNLFNDLVVGAQASQAAILLRSRPVVDVTVDLSTSVSSIQLTNRSCTIAEATFPCFDVTFTASYSGKGASGRLDNVPFLIRDISPRIGDEQRIFFTGPSNEIVDTHEGTLNFPSTGTDVEVTVRAYAEPNINSASRVVPYTMAVIFPPIDRPTALGSDPGNDPLSDLSPYPEIRPNGILETNVTIDNDCGPDDVCRADIDLEDIAVLFLDAGDVEMTDFIAGETATVELQLRLRNIESEPAFSTSLIFSLPEEFTTVSGGGCDSDVVGRDYVCIRNDIIASGEAIVSTLFLTVDQDNIFGDSGPIVIDFSVTLNNSVLDTDIDLSNNMANVTLTIVGQADIAVRTLFSPAEVPYQFDVDAPGASVVFIVTIENVGPTTIRESNFSIFYPEGSPSISGSENFLSIVDYTVNSQFLDAVECYHSSGSSISLVSSGKRRRRSLPHLRNTRSAMWGKVRARRQSNDEAVAPIAFDCSNQQSSCLMIMCTVTNLRQDPLNVEISAIVNQQFFANQTAKYELTGYAEATDIDSFLTDSGVGPDFSSALLTLNPPPPIDEEDTGVLIHAIIWPIIGAVILLILLFIALYFCGFFRRKKPEEKGAAMRVEEVGGTEPPEPEKPAEGTTL